MTYCNSCVDPDDDRYNEFMGCIEGGVYDACDHPLCGGMCEYVGDCDCPCHRANTQPVPETANQP